MEARSERCGLMVAEARGRSDRMEVEIRRLRAENSALQQQVHNLGAWRDKRERGGAAREEEGEEGCRSGGEGGVGERGERVMRLREVIRGGKEAAAGGSGVGEAGPSRHVSSTGASIENGRGAPSTAMAGEEKQRGQQMQALKFWSRKDDEGEEGGRSEAKGPRRGGGGEEAEAVLQGEEEEEEEEDDTRWVAGMDQQEQRERAAVRAQWADGGRTRHNLPADSHRPPAGKAREATGLLAVSPAQRGSAGGSNGVKSKSRERSSKAAAVHSSLDRIIQELMG
jgi:hypothetical protein